MKSFKIISRVVAIATMTYGIMFASSALAAPPQSVTTLGAYQTAVVPGKVFTMKFRVKNTSTDTYSGIKVTFHLPGELTASTVSPGSANVDGHDISWTNVPLEPGQSFYPSFTFTVDSGTSIGTKLNIWVQVTGSGMEETSQNFSFLTKKTSTTTSTLSSTAVSNLFKAVYGRAPSTSELKYWLSRRTDKPTSAALKGAMAFHKANHLTH